MYKLKVKYLVKDIPKITMPRVGDLGIDIYAAEDTFLDAFKFKYIKTGIAFDIPEGFALIVKDRSSRAKQYKTLAGVIDSSFKGEIQIAVQCNDFEYFIHRGDKIAQLLIVKDLNSEFELEETDILSESKRGDKGFGSTGS
jgi:dUTP pyrophosphatase